MVKVILQAGDLHIPLATRKHEEFKTILSLFIEQIKDIVSQYEKDEVILCLCGDTVDSKNNTSNDLYLFMAWFFRELDSIGCEVITIFGNHDGDFANTSKTNTLEPIFKVLDLKNVVLLDMELGYKSGNYISRSDKNVVFHLYSIFEDYKEPDIELYKINNPNEHAIHIGLFHGSVIASETDSKFALTSGVSLEIFEPNDLVLMSDIHRRSFFNYKNTILAYPGSITCLNFGENISKKGFLEWNIEDHKNITYEEHDIVSDYGYYKFKANSLEEIVEGTEEFINF